MRNRGADDGCRLLWLNWLRLSWLGHRHSDWDCILLDRELLHISGLLPIHSRLCRVPGLRLLLPISELRLLSISDLRLLYTVSILSLLLTVHYRLPGAVLLASGLVIRRRGAWISILVLGWIV